MVRPPIPTDRGRRCATVPRFSTRLRAWPQASPPAPPVPSAPSVSASAAAPGRGDVVDPTQNPTAPGAPRTLGTLSEGAGPPGVTAPMPEPPDVGVPGGRSAGAPLDLSSLSGQAARGPPPGGGPAPPPAGVGPAARPLPAR